VGPLTTSGFRRSGDRALRFVVEVEMKYLAIVLTSLGFALSAPGHAAETQPPLMLDATIPLERVSGRIDHMAIDLGRERLIVAELGNNSIDVIDLARRTAVHRIGGLNSIKQQEG
jgi:hypothetical protein